jgi:hypothetical protein
VPKNVPGMCSALIGSSWTAEAFVANQSGRRALQAHIEELPRISQVTTVTLAAQR